LNKKVETEIQFDESWKALTNFIREFVEEKKLSSDLEKNLFHILVNLEKEKGGWGFYAVKDKTTIGLRGTGRSEIDNRYSKRYTHSNSRLVTAVVAGKVRIL